MVKIVQNIIALNFIYIVWKGSKIIFTMSDIKIVTLPLLTRNHEQKWLHCSHLKTKFPFFSRTNTWWFFSLKPKKPIFKIAIV